jgi:hypothetical protein
MQGYRTIISAVVGLLAYLANQGGVTFDQEGTTQAVLQIVQGLSFLAVIWFRFVATKDIRRGVKLKKG